MSGSLNTATAEAALTLALQAEARAKGISVREVAVARSRARVLEHSKAKDPTGAGLPARSWAAIPERTRLVLVMLACTASGEAQRLCRQPWGSFSPSDQDAMAAAARTLKRDLVDAASLF